MTIAFCRIVFNKDLSIYLCIYDNCGGGSATWVVWANTRLVTISYSFYFLFLCFLRHAYR